MGECELGRICGLKGVNGGGEKMGREEYVPEEATG